MPRIFILWYILFFFISCRPGAGGLVLRNGSPSNAHKLHVTGWQMHTVVSRISSQSIFNTYGCPEWRLMDSLYTEVDESGNGYIFYWFMGGDSVYCQTFYEDGYLKNEEVLHIGGRGVEDGR